MIVGVSRHIGLRLISPLLQDAPYDIVAVLDLVTSPEPYRYTPQDLGVVLNALHPRSRAIIVGTAVDPKYLPELENAWQEFNNGMMQESSEDGVAEASVMVLVRTRLTI